VRSYLELCLKLIRVEIYTVRYKTRLRQNVFVEGVYSRGKVYWAWDIAQMSSY
jgi:hypothetical protein